MVMKTVQKAKGAEAIQSRKLGKKYRQKNKHKLNKAAKQKYKLMKPAEKLAFHARQVFTKAMRHGATEAEAKKVVMAWKKRRKHRDTGKHAAGQRREVTAAQRQIREQIRKKSLGLQSAHQKALSKIRSAKVPPAKRAAMRQAEKASYANARKNLAGERTKAAQGHKAAMSKIKAKGKFSLKSLISNFKAKPISSQGKRLVEVGKKAASDGVSKIAQKHFGGVTKKAPKSAAKAPAKSAGGAAAKKPAANKLSTSDTTPLRELVRTKRAYNKKPKADAAPAAAAGPKLKKDGTPAAKRGPKPKGDKAPTVAAKPAAKKPASKKTAAAKPAAAEPKLKKDGTPAAKRGPKPKGDKAPTVAAKPAAKKPASKKTAAAKPAAAGPKLNKDGSVPKKRGPKGKAAAAPAEAAKPAAKKPAVKKAAAKPAKEKAAAKPAAKPAAKKPAAKPAKEKAAAPSSKKAAAKTGGAVPKQKFA